MDDKYIDDFLSRQKQRQFRAKKHEYKRAMGNAVL
jgi:hypothetical protein